MNQSTNQPIEPETETYYTIDLIAELSGTDTKTILHYQELGVISPTPETQQYNTETLRQLCRLEHLRQAHTLSDSATKLVAGLLTEIESLRQQHRQNLR